VGVSCEAWQRCEEGSCCPTEPCSEALQCQTQECAWGTFRCQYDTDAGETLWATEGESCTDTDACTLDDVCVQGECRGAPLACEDPQPAECRGDQRVSYRAPGTCQAGLCQYEEVVEDCPDGCSAGLCNGDPCSGATCDDGNPCTVDSCVPGTGCAFDPLADGTDCGVCAACLSGSCAYDSSQHAECGVCQKCTALNTCGFQSNTEDLKDECNGGGCVRENCNGSGSCLRADGYDCGTCAACDGGSCVYDSTQHADCGVCQRCTSRYTCGNQTANQDLKDDCAAGECTTGNCSGSGASCGRIADGTDCGTRFCSALEWRQPTCLAGACAGSVLLEDCSDAYACTNDLCDATGCSNNCTSNPDPCLSGWRCGIEEFSGDCTCVPD